jgi:tRNA pseudouridine55 synthase
LAEGVLPVLVGRATRLADLIHSGSKTYVTTIKLGIATETDDAEAPIAAEAPVPSLRETHLAEVLSQFRGEIQQVPPKYSALKVSGQRAYALARAGSAVDLQPRLVTISELKLIRYTVTDVTLEVTCSKGTYIRALARDIALALGTVGHMASLLRTRVGPYSLADALSLDEIAARGVPNALLPASTAIPDAPTFLADASQAARFANGQALSATGMHDTSVWVYDPVGRLIGLGSAQGDLLRPRLAL